MKMLTPFEKTYHLLSAAKNYLYDKNILPTVSLSVPVISVGNLSFGGTAKTPHVQILANELAKNFKIVIVSRSYKTNLKKPQRVDLNLPNCAHIFGDEACLLQKKLVNCTVWSGPVKFETAQACLVDKPDLIILDDGFSHRQLKRQVDIVLIDAKKGFQDYLRESVCSLKRADFIILTRTQNAEDSEIQALREKVISLSPKLENRIFLSDSITDLDAEPLQPLYLFSAIANSQLLYEELQKRHKILKHVTFSDHHMYTNEEEETLYGDYLSMKQESPKLVPVCTEKDFVKIKNEELKKNIRIVHLDTILRDKEALLAQIRHSL